MSGVRLIVGIIVMGAMIPGVIFFFLGLTTLSQFSDVAIPSFFGWCIAEFVANVLARPRLVNRSPSAAIREWDQSDDVNSPDHAPRA